MAIPPGVSGLVLTLGLMQAGRKIPWDNDDVLMFFRVAWVSVQLLCIAVYYYTSIKIKQKNDTTMLKYVEPKAPGQESEKVINTTVRDYDLQQCSSGIRSTLIGIAMTGAIHVYFKANQPLFLQSVMPLKNLYEQKILQIHLLGKPATGDLKRPFKVPNMLAGLTGGAVTTATDDPATVKKLEEKPVLAKKDD